MFENRRMPNGMSERARSRGHAVWEGVPCKGALYPIEKDGIRNFGNEVPVFPFPYQCEGCERSPFLLSSMMRRVSAARSVILRAS